MWLIEPCLLSELTLAPSIFELGMTIIVDSVGHLCCIITKKIMEVKCDSVMLQISIMDRVSLNRNRQAREVFWLNLSWVLQRKCLSKIMLPSRLPLSQTFFSHIYIKLLGKNELLESMHSKFGHSRLILNPKSIKWLLLNSQMFSGLDLSFPFVRDLRAMYKLRTTLI